jgi:hypothetical protein
MSSSHSHAKYASVRTGDILLFSAWSLTSLFIRAGTYSEWTHAAIAVWLRTTEGRKLYLFESSRYDDEFCALRNDTGKGARLIGMDQIDVAYSRVAARPVNVARDEVFYDRLRRFMHEYKGSKFPTNFPRLFLVNTGIVRRRQDDDGMLLCSDLCSRWLEWSGVTSKEYVAAHPHHLVTPSCFSEDLRFPGSTFVGPLSLLKDDGMDNTVRISVGAVWICSLFLYVLLSIEDEQRYLDGERRRGTRWLENRRQRRQATRDASGARTLGDG